MPYRVVERAPETADTWTLQLEPLGESIIPAPGQFNMLYAFGVGEVPISTSAGPEAGGELATRSAPSARSPGRSARPSPAT